MMEAVNDTAHTWQYNWAVTTVKRCRLFTPECTTRPTN